MTTTTKIDDKYAVEMSEDCRVFRAIRHGEPWRDLSGDKLVAAMLARIQGLELALRPFAEAYREWEGIGADNLTLRQAHAETPDMTDDKPVTVEHLRAAWEALK